MFSELPPRPVTDAGADARREVPVPGSVRRLRTREEIDALLLPSLSDHFDPFLPYFASEVLRCGGEVTVAERDGGVAGLLLYHDLERVASVFTRDRRLAEAFARRHDAAGVFSDFPLDPGAEAYSIYAAEPLRGGSPPRFVHPVRAGRNADRAPLVRLMQEVYGRVDERWIDPVERTGEKCFVVEVGGEVAGAAWVSVVGAHARLHSLSVRPGFRRMRVGTDLWRARMYWAEGAGARKVVTEISEHNRPSRAIAEAGGMRPVGQVFLTTRA